MFGCTTNASGQLPSSLLPADNCKADNTRTQPRTLQCVLPSPGKKTCATMRHCGKKSGQVTDWRIKLTSRRCCRACLFDSPLVCQTNRSLNLASRRLRGHRSLRPALRSRLAQTRPHQRKTGARSVRFRSFLAKLGANRPFFFSFERFGQAVDLGFDRIDRMRRQPIRERHGPAIRRGLH